MALVKLIEKFLKKHLCLDRPILIGYSGGSDSSVLLDLFSKISLPHSLKIYVIHVDHSWREESTQEACLLEKYVKERYGYHWILERVSSTYSEKNPEGEARLQRIECFKKWYDLVEAQGVFLAHQQDDVVETVLKRVGEGASLEKLHGPLPVHRMYGMTFYRPMLKMPKEDIRDYLTFEKLFYIEDKTNADCRFHRARMRHEIIPFFEEKFGKKIKNNLSLLAERSAELDEYLSDQTQKMRMRHIVGVLGSWLDLKGVVWSPIELRWFLKTCFFNFLSVPETLLQQISDHVACGVAHKKIEMKSSTIIVDRERIFLIHKELVKKFEITSMTLYPKNHEVIRQQNWRDVWISGELIWPIRSHDYPFLKLDYNGKWKERWRQAQVPYFLKEILPVLTLKNEPIVESFTGEVASGVLSDFDSYLYWKYEGKM